MVEGVSATMLATRNHPRRHDARGSVGHRRCRHLRHQARDALYISRLLLICGLCRLSTTLLKAGGYPPKPKTVERPVPRGVFSLPGLRRDGATGGGRGILCPRFRGHQCACHSRQACYCYAQGHETRAPHLGRTFLIVVNADLLSRARDLQRHLLGRQGAARAELHLDELLGDVRCFFGVVSDFGLRSERRKTGTERREMLCLRYSGDDLRIVKNDLLDSVHLCEG